jgi:hypothetical protein
LVRKLGTSRCGRLGIFYAEVSGACELRISVVEAVGILVRRFF